MRWEKRDQVTINPVWANGRRQLPIKFSPVHDTVVFDSRNFTSHSDVYQFLKQITEKERGWIRRIALYMKEQSWFDTDDTIPCQETLLLMKNLRKVTYLEDRINVRDAMTMEGRDHKADYNCEAIAESLEEDNKSWRVPDFDFALDLWSFGESGEW